MPEDQDTTAFERRERELEQSRQAWLEQLERERPEREQLAARAGREALAEMQRVTPPDDDDTTE